MALITEDGTGLVGAESYVSEAYSLTYHAAIGISTWATITQAQREQALRRATDYMEQAYRLRWAGYRRTDTQALAWPRSYVPRPDTAANAYYGSGVGYYAHDSVPAEVQKACASLALRAAAGELLSDQTQRKSSVTIGPISTTYEAGSKLNTTYTEIDALLRPLMKSGRGQIQLVRV